MPLLRGWERFASSLPLVLGWAAGASAMSFQPIDVGGRMAFVASGIITLDTPDAFAALPVPPGTPLYINSPGGNVGAAMQLGSLFRSRGVTAVVAAVAGDGAAVGGACYSACVYALVGAARRVVPDGSRVGIHRMQAAATDMQGADERSEHRAATDVLMEYTAQMGVDPSMIAFAEHTPSTSIHVLTHGELRRWGVSSASR